jgi:hypothetical protein
MMKRVAVISFDDNADVTDGLEELLDKYDDIHVMLAVVGNNLFVKSALKAMLSYDVSFTLYVSETEGIEHIPHESITICSNPVKEIMRHIEPHDVLAMVWDDSLEAHAVLHSLEDFGLEMWDITDGLDVIEIDYDDEDTTDDLYDIMTTTLNLFAESLTAYVTSAVLDVLADTIKNRMEEEDDMKDISPFDDDL